MDIIDILSREFKISSVNDSEHCLRYEITTPSNVFVNYVWPINNELLICLPIKGKRKDAAAIKLLESASKQRGAFLSGGIYYLPCPKLSDCCFDRIIALNPAFHDTFLYEATPLHEKTIVIFPVWTCEFTYHETPDLMKLRREEFVSTLDWSRLPSPVVFMRFQNAKAGIRSVGDKLGMTRLDDLIKEMSKLPVDDYNSFIEAENYLGQRIMINALHDGVSLTTNGQVELVAFKDAKEKIKSFFVSGA